MAKKKKAKKAFLTLSRMHPLLYSVVGILCAILLFASVFLLFERAFRAAPAAKFLPAERTVGVLEIMTNPEHIQFLRTQKLVKDRIPFAMSTWKKWLKAHYKVDYSKDIAPWLGRQLSLALLTGGENEAFVVVAAEIAQKDHFTQILARHTHAMETYKGAKIYELPLPAYLTVRGGYAFISQDKGGVQSIIDARSEKKLYRASRYRRIDDNMPLNKIAFLYLNIDALNDAAMQKFAVLSEKGLTLEVITPLQNFFNAEGAALIALEDHFALQSFLSLDERIARQGRYYFNTKYRAMLTQYIDDEALALWGGEDLKMQINRTIHMLSGSDDASRTMLTSLLENQVKKYFGSETQMDKDIFSLLRGEFVIAIEKYQNIPYYKAVLTLKNQEQDAEKIQKLAHSFAKVSAIFEPSIVTHTLEDGTVSREIVATPQEILQEEYEHSGVKIHKLNLGEENWGVFYAILDNIAVLATHHEGIARSIDIHQGKRKGFRETVIFAREIAPILVSADEISYFNIEKLLPLLFSEKIVPAATEIGTFSSGKNYFHDGITSVSFIRLK